MALIKCPECGKQISDKAEVCPHCGMEVQIVLAEIREKEKRQRKKRKKRIFISITSVCVATAVAVLAYLYYIDALNPIPTDYRKQTKSYFVSAECAINESDFDKGTRFLNTLKSRTLTKRQAKRLEEMENVRAEVGLKNLENKLASISDNSGIQIIDVVLQETRNNLNTLTIYQLDVSQVERLKKAWANYKDLRLVEIEN